MGRSAYYYLRYKDRVFGKPLKKLRGLPIVPEPYGQTMRHGFTAKVIRTLTSSRLVIDRGTAGGVMVGTKLTAQGKWVNVVSVSADQSICTMWNDKDALLAPGALLKPVGV